jgi:hypothetical protein
MRQNLENAVHGLQEARTAIFLETGNPVNTDEQKEALEAMSTMLNEVESMINAH